MDAFHVLEIILAGFLFAVPFYLIQFIYLFLIIAINALSTRNGRHFRILLTFLVMRFAAHVGYSLLIALVLATPWASVDILMYYGWERAGLVFLFLLFDLILAPIILAVPSMKDTVFDKRVSLAFSVVTSGFTTFCLIVMAYRSASQ